jgi:hypothetical protein
LEEHDQLCVALRPHQTTQHRRKRARLTPGQPIEDLLVGMQRRVSLDVLPRNGDVAPIDREEPVLGRIVPVEVNSDVPRDVSQPSRPRLPKSLEEIGRRIRHAINPHCTGQPTVFGAT